MFGERARRVRQQLNGMHHTICQYGFVNIQFEMALAPGNGDGGLVTEHLTADHGQCFALGRVDLAGHDRRARFVFRQDQLAETGTRARAQQANVIGDLEQAGRH